MVSCVCPLFEFLNRCRPRIFSVNIRLQAFFIFASWCSWWHWHVTCVHVFTLLFLWIKGMCGHLVTWIFYSVILSQWYPCIRFQKFKICTTFKCTIVFCSKGWRSKKDSWSKFHFLSLTVHFVAPKTCWQFFSL